MSNTGLIARRYLFSKKHISLISTLTTISITGITIGTALLIVVLSVFNGFFEVIKGLLLHNDPDVRIESAEGSSMLYQPATITELQNIPLVQVATPYVTGKALLAYNNGRQNTVVKIKGIQSKTYQKLNDLKNSISSGTMSLGIQNGYPGILVNEQLMAKLNLQIGDRVLLLSATGMRKSLTQFSIPRSYQFEVRGSYNMIQIVEDAAVYVDLEAAQRLFGLRNSISGIDLGLTTSDDANTVKAQAQNMLGKKYKISTWYDLQRPLYDVMYLEKWGSYIILMIIVLVAALNIIGSLTMIVIQKNRDIGVLLTLGYTPAQVKRIFMKQGLYIGLIGCTIGGALGLFLSWLQETYGIIKLSSAFVISAYPSSIHAADISIILIGSLLLCLIASWYPAKRAALVEPADAVRYE